jgi:hypothetical protein
MQGIEWKRIFQFKNQITMKHRFHLLALPVILLAVQACKKSSLTSAPLASVNVTNVVVGGALLTYNSTTLTVGNNNYAQLTMNAGSSVLDLYPAANPQSPYYNQTIQTAPGENYSLFLSGASPIGGIDAVLIKESYTNYIDSVCGVRFINLSPNSDSISVNVTGLANGSLVSGLGYKQYSGFIKLPAMAANPTYAFQIRDVGTGNVLASYTLTTPYFNNVTIVFRGLIGAPGTLLVKNY